MTRTIHDVPNGEEQRVTLGIGGRTFQLVGDGEDPGVRGLAVALQAAYSVHLVLEESPRHPAPGDVT